MTYSRLHTYGIAPHSVAVRLVGAPDGAACQQLARVLVQHTLQPCTPPPAPTTTSAGAASTSIERAATRALTTLATTATSAPFTVSARDGDREHRDGADWRVDHGGGGGSGAGWWEGVEVEEETWRVGIGGQLLRVRGPGGGGEQPGVSEAASEARGRGRGLLQRSERRAAVTGDASSAAAATPASSSRALGCVSSLGHLAAAGGARGGGGVEVEGGGRVLALAGFYVVWRFLLGDVALPAAPGQAVGPGAAAR